MTNKPEPSSTPPAVSGPEPPTKVEDLAGLYLKNPVVRSLAQVIAGVIPFGLGSAADTLLLTLLENAKQRKLKAFFQELDAAKAPLTPQLIEDHEFLHCFTITLRAVDRTHRDEKVRMFARLLSAASAGDNAPDVDEYEELLGIVDQLSAKEFRVLLALEDYEATYYHNGRFKLETSSEGLLLQLATTHLGLQQDQLTDDELRAIVMRLNRVGCYGLFGWRQGPAKDCSLTPVYRRLKQLIVDRDGKLI